MNGIVRSLLIVAAIGLLAVVIVCASDDSEAEIEVVFEDGIVIMFQDRSGAPPYTQYRVYDSPAMIDDSFYIIATAAEEEYGNIYLNGVDEGIGDTAFRAADYPNGIHFEVFRLDYSIEFGRNGGEGDLQPSITNMKNSDNYVIPDVLYTRLGYSSVEWNTREDGTGEIINPGNYTMDLDFIRNHYTLTENNLVIYPKWVLSEYSINYNLNHGTGQLPNGISGKTIGMGTTIQPVGLSRIGYTTSIWNTSPDGSGLDVDVGDVVFDASFITNYFGNGVEITLYPKWVANHYAIRFDSTEEMKGALPDSLNNFTIDSVINVASASLTRTGYVFSGWNTSADRTGDDLQPGEYTIDADFLEKYYESPGSLVLYPKWIPAEYSISLTSEFGTVSVVDWSLADSKLSRSYNIESDLILLPTLEPEDRFHQFVNWEDNNGNPVSQIESGTVGDIELKAVWIEKSYPVIAKINGKEVTFDLTISSEMPTAEAEDGFEFKGWYYRDGEGNEVRFESMSQINENMEIYAVFEPTQDDPMVIAGCVIGLILFFTVVIGYGFTRE